VDLILGGHLHRSYTASSHDAFPPADQPPAGEGSQPDDGFAASDSATGILIVECGTSTSSRGRGRERRKNSLNVIQLDDRTTTVTHWLFSPSAGSFVPASRHVFPRRGGLFSGR
jgi:hypothetical protein